MYNIIYFCYYQEIPPPLSNFRIVSEEGRTKDLKTQNWQLYKSPERASAVSTNIWGDQPSRRSGSGFIVFGSEAWVPVTSLGACDQSVCLEEYQLPVELDTKICLSFISCSSSVQHWESLGLFGLIVHGTAHLPIYKSGVLIEERDHISSQYLTKPHPQHISFALHNVLSILAVQASII